MFKYVTPVHIPALFARLRWSAGSANRLSDSQMRKVALSREEFIEIVENVAKMLVKGREGGGNGKRKAGLHRQVRRALGGKLYDVSKIIPKIQ